MTPASWTAVETADGPTSFPVTSVVRAGAIVATAGQVPMVDGVLVSGGIEAETRAALDNLRKTLQDAGCTLSDVFKVNAYIADLADVDLYNKVYREYFSVPFPARTTVGAALLGFKIEIEAWASRPSAG